MYFVVLRGGSSKERVLIGTAGYQGPPGADGAAEIGYGIVSEHQRRGYATEAARALASRAFEDPRVTHVIAHTLPALVASIGVLEKCGFRLVGPGSEPDSILFRLDRDAADS